MTGRIKVFGASLDVLDGYEKIGVKRAYISALCKGIEISNNYLDPYDALIMTNPEIFGETFELIGKLPIETWLTPKPLCEDLEKITSDQYKAFLENNGCKIYAENISQYICEILPNPFLMLGVDHSQTGGVLTGLSRHFGPDLISVIVLDAHLDMFDFELLYAVQKKLLGLEDNSSIPIPSPYDNEFYGCGNYLKYLIEEKAILPENLFVIGVTNIPNEDMRNQLSPEVESYIRAYEEILSLGVNIISSAEAEQQNELEYAISKIKTPYVYVSIDMDVGAISTTRAVRFLNTIGMKEESIYNTVRTIKKAINQKNISCIGMDLMEFDVHFAGYPIGGVEDRIYKVASNIINEIFN